MISGNQILIERIIQKIISGGPIPFKVFMEMSLYDPEVGYYTSSREKIGKKGDFYTSPEVHTSFGKIFARQLGQIANLILKDGPECDFVEAGPGNGTFALQIVKTLLEEFKDIFDRLTYFMVESSPGLIQRQRELFSSYPEFRSKIRWVSSLNELPPIQGVVFSNEVLDAFPVHRVVWKEGLKEIFVAFDGKRFFEIVRPLSDPAIEHYFNIFRVNWIENQEAEANLSAVNWIKEAAGKIKRGFVITVDYGEQYHELYSLRRKKGTFLCYRKHKTSHNPYEWVGEQDMTSHINFSALQKSGEEENLFTLGYLEQSHFLIGLGMVDEIDKHVRTLKDPTRDESFRAMKHLIHPEGLGPVFKVLIQQKGIGMVRLEGLKFARGIHQK